MSHLSELHYLYNLSDVVTHPHNAITHIVWGQVGMRMAIILIIKKNRNTHTYTYLGQINAGRD